MLTFSKSARTVKPVLCDLTREHSNRVT